MLCYLEGLTTEAAARRLGCAQGTVMSRLSRARERLRQRLTRRGLAPAVGLLTAGLSADAAKAAVPAAMAHSVVRLRCKWRRVRSAAGEGPATVAALTEGVLKMMVRSRLKGIAGAVLVVGALTAGMGMLVYRTAGARPQEAPAGRTAKAAAPVRAERRAVPNGATDRPESSSSGPTICRETAGTHGFMGIVAIDMETAKWRTIFKEGVTIPGRISPDGRYLVSPRLDVEPDRVDAGVWVYDMTGQTPPRRIFERNGEPFWVERRPAGHHRCAGRTGYRKFETWRVNADGTGRTRLPIPEGDLVLDCSRDGTWLATRTIGGEPAHKGRLTLVHPDGTGARHLTEGSAKDDLFSIFKISPDGRSVAYAEIKTVDNVRHARLFVVDIEGKHRREIPITFEPGMTVTVRWSPDGSRLGLNLHRRRDQGSGSIALVDLDGSNFRKVPLPPGRWNLHVCDWKRLAPGLRPQSLDQPPDPKTTRGRYQALLEEYETAFRLTIKPQERQDGRGADRVYREKYPQPRSYIGRFLQIAESAPADPAAVDALIWIVTARL